MSSCFSSVKWDEKSYRVFWRLNNTVKRKVPSPEQALSKLVLTSISVYRSCISFGPWLGGRLDGCSLLNHVKIFLWFLKLATHKSSWGALKNTQAHVPPRRVYYLIVWVMG